jgi:hypothetical protein
MRAISASKGVRGPACNDTATNRDNTSNPAESEAAEVWARSIGPKLLTGLVLPDAATRSAMAW